MARTFRLCLLVLATAGCGGGGIPPGVRGVLVSDPPGQSSEAVEVRSLDVDLDTLEVGVKYGGGCGDHGFELRWSGKFEPGSGAATLVLAHDANGDACEERLTRWLRFDLLPIRDAWQQWWGRESGTVRLDLDGSELTADYRF